MDPCKCPGHYQGLSFSRMLDKDSVHSLMHDVVQPSDYLSLSPFVEGNRMELALQEKQMKS